MHLVGWDTITKPKNQGGQGIQKVECKNKAIHSGLAWRVFHNTSTPWAKTLIAKHCNWGHPPHQKAKSSTWQCILKGWDTCRKAIRCVVHKGDRVSFINDSWIPNYPPIRNMIEGPLSQTDLSAKVATIYNNRVWDTYFISLSTPPNIIDLLN